MPPPVNAAPAVWLNAPLIGAAYLNGDTIPFNASATDSDGTIARVEFWADGVKLGQSTVAPFLWNWPGSPRHRRALSLGYGVRQWRGVFDLRANCRAIHAAGHHPAECGADQ